MARQPKTFFAGTVSGAPAARYTAPTYIPTVQSSVLRYIRVHNGGAAGSYMIGIGGADSVWTRIVNDMTIAGSTTLEDYVYIPLASGSAINVGASAGMTQMNFVFGGDENSG